MANNEKRDLEHRQANEAFTRRASDLERVEMLAVALDAFARPVPDYEPRLPPRILHMLQRGKN